MTTATATTRVRREPRLAGTLWVVWRQHRVGLLAVAALFAAAVVLLLATGHAMHAAIDRPRVRYCVDQGGPACDTIAAHFHATWDGRINLLPKVFLFLPAVVGLFLGAPLVAREYESGTFRFAWTQGIGRVRWLTARLVVLAVAVLAFSVPLAALLAWWYGPIVASQGRMQPGGFYEVVGPVFVARGLFAFALGVLVGALARRVVVAIAVSALVWLALAWPTTALARQHLQAPIEASQESPQNNRQAWDVDEWIAAPDGHRVSDDEFSAIASRVAPIGPVGTGPTDPQTDPVFQWLRAHGYRDLATLQPGSRFWRFQLTEGAGYLVVAAALGAASIAVVRRRG